MVKVLIISAVAFVILALIYEFYQNPNFLKKQVKKPKKEQVDPDTHIDEEKLSYKQKKKTKKIEQIDEPVEQTYSVEDIEEYKPELKDNKNDISTSQNKKENDRDLEELLDKLVDEDDDFEDDFEQFFDEDEDDSYFKPYDPVDADSLDEYSSDYSYLGKQIASMPSALKTLILSDILDRKNL